MLGAAIRGERAYDPAGTKDANGGRTDWMRWLDLLETRGGVSNGADVFRRWVLTGQQRAALAPRAKARTAYAAVDEADGAWLPPEGLRDAMTDWDFERADAVREKVAGLGAAATAVQTAAERAGIEVPDAVRAGYERAEQDEQYTALATTLPKAAAAVTAVGAAEQAAGQDRDPVSALGATLLGVDDRAAEASALLDDGQYAAATTVADDATSRSEKALLVGLALPMLLVLLVAGLVLWVRRSMARRGRHGAQSQAGRPGGDAGGPSPVASAAATRPGARGAGAARGARGRGLENPQHPGVAQGVRLDPLQVEELGDALVVAAQQLGVDLGVDGLALDRLEPVPGEERGLEGEAEQPAQAEPPGPLDEPLEHGRADPGAEHRGVDGQGAHLPEVLPEHVQGAAADDPPVDLGDDEVGDRLVVGDGLLVQQHPPLGQRRHERADGADVGRARGPDDDGIRPGWLRGGVGRHHWSVSAARRGPTRTGPGHGRGPPPQGWWRAAHKDPQGSCVIQCASGVVAVG